MERNSQGHELHEFERTCYIHHKTKHLNPQQRNSILCDQLSNDDCVDNKHISYLSLKAENPCSKLLMETWIWTSSTDNLPRPCPWIIVVPTTPQPIFPGNHDLSSFIFDPSPFVGFTIVIMMHHWIIDVPTTPHPIFPGKYGFSSFILDPSPFVHFTNVIWKYRSIAQEFSTFPLKISGKGSRIHPSTYQTTQAISLQFTTPSNENKDKKRSYEQHRNCTMLNVQ